MAPAPLNPGQLSASNVGPAVTAVNAVALGLGIGLTLALLLATVTAFHLIAQPKSAPNIELLSHYFYAYEVSWPGVAVGSLWAALAGYAAGWLAGTAANVAFRIRLLVLRSRAELNQPYLDEF